MATIDEIITAKKDYQLALNAQKIREIFSESVLGYYLTLNGSKTYETLVANTLFSLNKANAEGSLKGLAHLSNLTTIVLSDSLWTDIGNLSGLKNLTTLEITNLPNLTYLGTVTRLISLTKLNINTTNIKTIGKVDYLTLLTEINVYLNKLTNIGILTNLVNLVTVNLFGNQLTDIGSCTGLTKVVTFNLQDNLIPTSKVDLILSQFAAIVAAQGGSKVLTSLNLTGNGMGIPTGGSANASVVALRAAGVTVTIRA